LEPPENILAIVAKPSNVTRWTFEQTTEGAVRADLTKAGVPAAVIERLCNPVRMVGSGNNITLLPELEDLLAIPMEARSALYQRLAKHAANEYQRDPVHVLGGDVDDWLAETDLSAEQQDLFRRLLWRRGTGLVFSDIQALLSLAKGPEGVGAVFRAVTRVRSLLVELRLPLTDGRGAFLDYWSAIGLRLTSSRKSPRTFISTPPRPRSICWPHTSRSTRPSGSATSCASWTTAKASTPASK